MYSHCFYVELEYGRRPFSKLVNDFKRTVPVLKHLGIPLAGGLGTEKPTIAQCTILFNGAANCGYAETAADERRTDAPSLSRPGGVALPLTNEYKISEGANNTAPIAAKRALSVRRDGKSCIMIFSTEHDTHLGTVRYDGRMELLYLHRTKSGEQHHYRHVPDLPSRCKIECMGKAETITSMLEPDCVLTEAGKTMIASQETI